MSAPLTASTACLMRSCAAAAAWSSLRCSASARSRNGRGKTLETPDTAPVPPARTKSPNSMSLPEYTSKSSGTARTYCRTAECRFTADLRPGDRRNRGQFGELIRGDGAAGAGGVQVDVDLGVTGDGVQPAVVVDQGRRAGRQVERGDRGQVPGAERNRLGGKAFGLPRRRGADVGIHGIRPVHLERRAEHDGSFVVVQRGEFPGGAGDEHAADAGVLQVAQQRFLALDVQVTVGVKGHRDGGEKGGGRGHGQCESRVTVSPLEPTRKSRSTPRSACMTWSTYNCCQPRSGAL